MEFGILFTSHPNHATEPYPHRAVHARVTAEIQAADRLGYDTAWVAEHHFSNQYGIMPDVFTYMGYLAARTSRIRLGTAVVTLPLYDPIRVVENMAFVDILSGGRVVLGLGSGYRPYEFEGFGRDFESRRPSPAGLALRSPSQRAGLSTATGDRCASSIARRGSSSIPRATWCTRLSSTRFRPWRARRCFSGCARCSAAR